MHTVPEVDADDESDYKRTRLTNDEKNTMRGSIKGNGMYQSVNSLRNIDDDITIDDLFIENPILKYYYYS